MHIVRVRHAHRRPATVSDPGRSWPATGRAPGAPQFRHQAEHAALELRARPRIAQQIVLRHDLARPAGERHQHRHGLRLEPHPRRAAHDLVGLGPDLPLADASRGRDHAGILSRPSPCPLDRSEELPKDEGRAAHRSAASRTGARRRGGTAAARGARGRRGTCRVRRDDAGGHSALPLPAGTWTIRASRVGYGRARKDVTVEAGETNRSACARPRYRPVLRARHREAGRHDAAGHVSQHAAAPRGIGGRGELSRAGCRRGSEVGHGGGVAEGVVSRRHGGSETRRCWRTLAGVGRRAHQRRPLRQRRASIASTSRMIAAR